MFIHLQRLIDWLKLPWRHTWVLSVRVVLEECSWVRKPRFECEWCRFVDGGSGVSRKERMRRWAACQQRSLLCSCKHDRTSYLLFLPSPLLCPQINKSVLFKSFLSDIWSQYREKNSSTSLAPLPASDFPCFDDYSSLKECLQLLWSSKRIGILLNAPLLKFVFVVDRQGLWILRNRVPEVNPLFSSHSIKSI